MNHGCALTGHSVGGSAIIQAEYTRPNQFKDIVAFEPVIYPSVEPREPIKDNTVSYRPLKGDEELIPDLPMHHAPALQRC